MSNAKSVTARSTLKTQTLLSCLFALIAHPLCAAGPLLTGIVEDGDSQTITMPGAVFIFMRQVEWIAPEGTHVEAGDLVARIAPGTLEQDLETHRTEHETQVVAAELARAQIQLEILDAEIGVANAQVTRDIEWLNAQVPATAITQLNYDKAQLALENAENALTLAIDTLANARQKFVEQEPVIEQRVNNSLANMRRMESALEETEIYAKQAGIVVYGENERTGDKIFVGETLTPGTTIATIATREQLQFVFWVHDADVLRLAKGQRLSVIADALPDTHVDATIELVANYATVRNNWSQGGYFKVVAKPTTTMPPTFLPGMSIFGEVNAVDAL